MKISKEELLFDKDITKRQYEELLGKINTRIKEIAKFIANLVYDGYFYFEYLEKEDFQFIGDFANLPAPYDDGYFPTRWIWEDFEEEFKFQVNKAKEEKIKEREKEKERRKVRKEKFTILQDSVRKKLTKEELKTITFKK